MLQKTLLRSHCLLLLMNIAHLINKNFVLGEQNSIYFNYLAPDNDIQGKLKLKILTNESKLKINERFIN